MKVLVIVLLFTLISREAANANSGNFRLKVDDVQILFVDLQPGLVNQSQTNKPARIEKASHALAKVAQILKIPMTFCIVPFNGKPGSILDGLFEFAAPSNTINRSVTDTFLEPKIVAALAANKRKTIIVAGYSTEVGVLQTVLGATHSGYSVQVPVDAIGSISARTENAAFTQIDHAGAVMTSVLTLVTSLEPFIGKAPGSLTFDAIKPILSPD